MVDTVSLITFGCRLNLYESEAMRALARTAGLESVVLVNTCAVTAEAERQARQAIRKARREKPDALLVVTGCAAQIHPDLYAQMSEVDAVLGNEAKMQAGTYALLKDKGRRKEGGDAFVRLTDIAQAKETQTPLVHGFSDGLSRGFVEVQNGCDHRCTYCVIPLGRGPSRSVPMQNVIDQVRLLVGQGYGEIALTGVDATAYGADLPERPTFGLLVKRVLMQVPTLRRLRLSSLDPVEIDEDLWRLIEGEPRLMPHLHLSLQSGDDMVLTRMKRRHRRKDIYAFVARARAARPEMAFGADLIAGFPTETEEMFANTCALLEALDVTWLHVFPYSARKGTPAARMPQVPVETRKARAAKLRALGEAAVRRHIDSLVGQVLEVHVEKPDLARTPTFAEVKLLSPGVPGQALRVRGVGRCGDKLEAQVEK